MIGREDQLQLLAIARRALEARVLRMPADTPVLTAALEEPCGAFVSIHCRGELRGCLGRIEIDWPLCRVVSHLAGAVADSDPRFDAVRSHELADIEIEISILTPAEEIRSFDSIIIGRHGLIVEQGPHRGLLLPQVAVEHGWDRGEFLDHVCIKAGLPPRAWQRGARVFTFEAQVFGEADVIVDL